MKTPWGREPAAHLQQTFSEEGVVYSPSENAADDWWSDPKSLASSLRPAAAYLGQLVNEGCAIVVGSTVIVPWGRVYDLQIDSSHADSIGLLALPATGDWAPCLQSQGTPSDQTFRLAIVGWTSPALGRRAPNRVGAVLESGGARWLMTEAAWRTSVLVRVFASGSLDMSSEQRMSALGEIRAQAVRAGASLDDYLARTEIVSPRKLEIELCQVKVLDVPVVEVLPRPVGAPDEFLSAFDRYESVRSRYDIAKPDGGMVHVTPSEAVVRTLSAIKAMPGRRMASEQARLFGHNPFAVLGDEAREALEEEALILARQEADLLPYRLVFQRGDDGDEPTIRLVPLSDTAVPTSVPATQLVARELLAAAASSRSRRLPLFHWEGHEIELGPVTEQSLTQLASWLAFSATAIRLSLAEVMDLEAYSDRVIGFEARLQTVPYVARRDSTAGWIPENVDTGIAVLDRYTGDLQSIAMPKEAISELQERIANALAIGQQEVILPTSDVSVPVARAQQLVAVFQNADISIGKKQSPIAQPADPKSEGKRAILQILHNIENLEYTRKAPASLDAAGLARIQIPQGLRSDVTLLPHQEEGLAWLQRQYGLQADGVSGCLLADDMGLGKTLQSLCLIAWHNENSTSQKPCLVVAPVSLLENWKLEIQKFLDWSGDDLLSLYGSSVAALRLPAGSIGDDLADVGIQKLLRPGFEAGFKVVLTTYETLRDYEFSLARVDWGVVVCDEAQKIKNPAAFVTQAAKALRADFRVACTGTPVENSLADLWCLFDFFQPGYLGSLNEFTRQFRQGIEQRLEGHSVLVDQLRAATMPWVLRRMKNEVHRALPAKLEGEKSDPSSLAIPMSPVQAKLYAETVASYRNDQKGNGSTKGAQILALISKLRMICAHPLGVLSTDHADKPLKEHLSASPKLAWLMGRLGEIQKRNEKVIVFTEFRDLQRLIQRAVAERFGYPAQIINGGTDVDPRREDSRQRLIDKFQAQDGFGVIILSTTAVGFGVNIQAANHVVHFTRPWNPAKEDQATDRAYRIGQTKDVYVYCPTLVGNGFESFEERLAHLLESKRELSRDMLSGVQEVTAEDFVDL